MKLSNVKTRFTTFTNSTWKGKYQNPNPEFGRIITTVIDDVQEILSTKENHTYRLNLTQKFYSL
jgi:hypothetical protein